MSRQCNWLKAYAEYTSESESPDSYHFWMGLSILASAIRKNVWLDQKLYRLFTNMYVVLIGPPGLGKSTAIRLGRRILTSIDEITMGPDSVTREELIAFMARVGQKSKRSAVTIHSTELSSLIEPSKIQMVQFLIDIYDSDDDPRGWRYSTKHQGKDVIYSPFLNIVAGTVPKYLADDFPVAIIGNGFTARTIFVYEEDPRFPNPFPKEPDPEIVVMLKDDLKEISLLEGEFSWEPAAKEMYKERYEELYNTRASDYRLEDFHNRKKIHLLKTAMLLSISESDDLILRPADLEAAWDLLNALEEKLPKAFSAVGKYEYASDMERIVAQIYREEQVPLQEIFKRNETVGDAETIGNILLLAEKAGRILRYRDEDTKEVFYKPGA